MTDLNAEDKKPISEVLNNIELELLQIEKTLENFQITLSPIIQSKVCTTKSSKDIQALDLVTQQVRELAVVMRSIASVMSPEWHVASKDVVALLSLQALASRIYGQDLADAGEAYGNYEML